MISHSRSDSEDEHDRRRSGTSPLRADRRASQSLFRNQWYHKNLITQCSTSPVGLGFELRTPPSLKSKKFGLLKKRVARTAGTTLWPATSKGSDTPATDESDSTTSRGCGNDGDSDFPTPRWNRRRHRNGNEDKRPPKRRKWLVAAIIISVVIFASMQIFALVVHPPRDGDRTTKSLHANNGVASVVSTGNDFYRRAGGVQNSLPSGEEEGSVNLQTGMTATTRVGDSRTVSHGGGNQHPDLFILNTRAFEMVAADMGHLRNMIGQLENVLKESMWKHEKDMSLVMRQFGLQPQRGTHTVKAEVDPTKEFTPKLFGGDPNDYKDGKHIPTEIKRQQPQQLPNEQSSSAEAAVSPGFKNLEDVQKELPGKSRGRQSPVVNSSPQERVRGNIRATRNDDDGWNPPTLGEWINEQWVAKVFVDVSPPDTSQLVEKQRRVLLLSERRSGAGTVGKVFNADPNIFYVGDPCRMGGGPEALFGDVCSMMVSRLLACQPTINDVRNLYSFSYIVEQSRPLSLFKSYRGERRGSPEANDELIKVSLTQLCGRSKVVMVKETRIAEVVPRVLMPELSVKFLLLVRDPRGALHGLSQSWERSKNEFDRAMSKNCTELAIKMCSSTEEKLESLIDHGNDRYRVLKYEMVTEAPFAMTKSIYAWLDLGDLPEEVLKALTKVSTEVAVPSPSGDAAQEGHRTTLTRFDWITRWAVEMPSFRRHQIQRACKPLLASLGYE